MAVTGDIFARLGLETKTRREVLMAFMDGINHRWGRGKLGYLAEGLAQPWQMKRQRMTPRYTTCWAELPVAVC